MKNKCTGCGSVEPSDELTIINTPDGNTFILCETCCLNQVESML